MWGSLAKTLGAIMGALVFAVGWVLNFTQNPIFSPQIISAIGFVLVVGFLSWIIFDLHQEVKSLKNDRPSIDVTPVGFDLKVKNNGAFATFSANIRFINVDEPTYAAYWKKANSYEAKIKKNDFDIIWIAVEANRDPRSEYFSSSAVLLMPYWDFSTDMHFLNQLKPGFGFRIFEPRKEEQLQEDKPEYELEVTISANPALLKDFTRHYKLDVKGIHEVTQPSASHKGGFQT